MITRELANADVLSYVSECWVVLKDGYPLMAVTCKEAAIACAHALGGFGCCYFKVGCVDLPDHVSEDC